MNNPKLSIITVNLNNAAGLRKTIESVVNQTFEDFEYIIIDGGSTDGSVDVIREYEDKITYWVSEPDNGIYNGMNKGILKAKGEYCLFLNSGDWLFDNFVLGKIIDANILEDIVYGDSCFIYPGNISKRKIMPNDLMGMTLLNRTLNHQSIFFKTSLFYSGMKYDEDYKFLADWVFYTSVVLLNGGSFRYLPLIVSNYDFSGFSSKPENKNLMEKERNKFYFDNWEFFLPHILSSYDSLLNSHNQLKSSFPVRIKSKIERIISSFIS